MSKTFVFTPFSTYMMGKQGRQRVFKILILFSKVVYLNLSNFAIQFRWLLHDYKMLSTPSTVFDGPTSKEGAFGDISFGNTAGPRHNDHERAGHFLTIKRGCEKDFFCLIFMKVLYIKKDEC